MASLETFHYRTYAFDTSSEVLNIYIYIYTYIVLMTNISLLKIYSVQLQNVFSLLLSLKFVMRNWKMYMLMKPKYVWFNGI